MPLLTFGTKTVNGARNSARSESAHSVAVLNALRNKKHKGIITMGLDQYLRARTNTIEQKSSRGACGGMFPIAPADKGTTEIGYWRKAYAVSDYLKQVLEIYDEFNLEDKEVPYNKVLEIIDYANEQIDRKAFEDEYELSDWQDTVEAFTKAKQILENDPDAEIYYLEWY